jgi:hypothetical protein
MHFNASDLPTCTSKVDADPIPDWHAAGGFNATARVETHWKTGCKDHHPVLESAYTLYADESPFCYEVMKTGNDWFDETYVDHCIGTHGFAPYLRDNSGAYPSFTLKRSDKSCAELNFPVGIGYDAFYKNAVKASFKAGFESEYPVWSEHIAQWANSKCADPCSVSCVIHGAGIAAGHYADTDIPNCPGASDWIPHWGSNVRFDATSNMEKHWKTCVAADTASTPDESPSPSDVSAGGATKTDTTTPSIASGTHGLMFLDAFTYVLISYLAHHSCRF